MSMNIGAVAVQLSNLEEKQKDLGLFAITTDPDVIDQQLADQAVSVCNSDNTA